MITLSVVRIVWCVKFSMKIISFYVSNDGTFYLFCVTDRSVYSKVIQCPAHIGLCRDDYHILHSIIRVSAPRAFHSLCLHLLIKSDTPCQKGNLYHYILLWICFQISLKICERQLNVSEVAPLNVIFVCFITLEVEFL